MFTSLPSGASLVTCGAERSSRALSEPPRGTRTASSPPALPEAFAPEKLGHRRSGP